MVMAGAATNEESFMLVSSVRGHHFYKRIWTPVNGQLFQVQAEAGNPHDSYAAPTAHGDTSTVVGHSLLESIIMIHESRVIMSLDLYAL